MSKLARIWRWNASPNAKLSRQRAKNMHIARRQLWNNWSRNFVYKYVQVRSRSNFTNALNSIVISAFSLLNQELSLSCCFHRCWLICKLSVCVPTLEHTGFWLRNNKRITKISDCSWSSRTGLLRERKEVWNKSGTNYSFDNNRPLFWCLARSF